MAITPGSEVYTVFNYPPFINEIIATIRPEKLSVREFNKIIQESAIYDIKTMLTAITRQKDVSGLVPNFAGICNDYKEVFKAMTDIGHQELMTLSTLDKDIQVEVNETLTGCDFSLRAMLVLDELQKDVIEKLTKIRQKSPLAMSIRQAAEDSLLLLYKSPNKMHSDIFDEAINYDDRVVLTRGEPRISYPREVVEDFVIQVWQYFLLPHAENIHLTGHFNKFTYSQILDNLTPEFYIRGSKYDEHYDPESPAGFLGLLGKVGNALPRLIVKQVKQNARINEMIMKEDAVSRALFELFTTYPKAN